MQLFILLIFTMNTFGGFFNTDKWFGTGKVDTKNKDAVSRREESLKLKTLKEKYPELLDPSKREFFREGNHMPDEAFIRMAQNPESVELAKVWILRKVSKAMLSRKLISIQERAKYELIRDGLILDFYDEYDYLRSVVDPSTRSSRRARVNLSNMDIYIVTSPSCSYCSKLAAELNGMSNVYPLQLKRGSEPLKHYSGLNKTSYLKNDLEIAWFGTGNIATPQIVIINPKNQKAVKVAGFKRKSEISRLAGGVL